MLDRRQFATGLAVLPAAGAARAQGACPDRPIRILVGCPAGGGRRIRAVAVTSRERMPQLPDVQTLVEGAPKLKDYELLNWFGLFAPAGTPEPVVARLNEVVNGGLRDKAIAENLTTQSIVQRLMAAPEYRAFVVPEAEKFGKIVAQANIKLQN